MHPLIGRILKKSGKNLDDLENEPLPDGTLSERETYEEWQRILSSNDEITVDQIKQFCISQIESIENKWKNEDNSPQKNERLIGLHTVYRAILKLIDAPKTEKESLEKYLLGLLNEK